MYETTARFMYLIETDDWYDTKLAWEIYQRATEDDCADEFLRQLLEEVK